MNDSRALVPPSDHRWRVHDELHRECTRCGLRIFWSSRSRYTSGGWMTYDHFGVPNELRALASRAGTFGDCVPPPPGETCIIEYTGDPEIHPGCERIMHRVPPVVGRIVVNGEELVNLSKLTPACGKVLEFWEVGSVRRHVGWTPCPRCAHVERAHPFGLLGQALNVVASALLQVDAAQEVTPKPKRKRPKRLKR